MIADVALTQLRYDRYINGREVALASRAERCFECCSRGWVVHNECGLPIPCPRCAGIGVETWRG